MTRDYQDQHCLQVKKHSQWKNWKSLKPRFDWIKDWWNSIMKDNNDWCNEIFWKILKKNNWPESFIPSHSIPFNSILL
jgi:hypothetical protein